jgi:feruloyl esterase
VISPVAGSRFAFELWLPQSGWNGKLQMFGNGGYSSKIGYADLAQQLRRGYATLGTDTGHTGDDPSFAAENPESIIDWWHRAVHESVTAAKAIVNQFYREPARHSYFSGCSTGGQQAFTEAQRYPKDFDGIIAGGPGHNRTHLNAGFLWQFLKTHRFDGSRGELRMRSRAAVYHADTSANLSPLKGVDHEASRIGSLPHRRQGQYLEYLCHRVSRH